MEYGEKFLKYKGRVVFGKQAMPYFDRHPKEYTSNEACFIFVNQGEVSVRSQHQYMDLNKNTAMLAKCLNYFFETDGEQKKCGDGLEVIAVIIYPELVEEIFEFNLSSSNYSLGYNFKKLNTDSLLANFKESINILIDNPELADENMIRTKLKEFILLIAKSENAPSELDFLAGLFDPVEVEFKSTIRHNLYANLSMEELARLCHLSLSSFKRKFNDTFLVSPKKYINQKKIEKAANLLKQENLRISDVAYEVGFDSLATFNRNFNAFFDKSPSEFRLHLKD
jgi:AraC-like DNA-binding protein